MKARFLISNTLTMKLFLTISILIFSTYCLQAQTVSGIITNNIGKPIEGAQINHTGTQVHSHSNAAGYFILQQVKYGDTLEITASGYQAQKVLAATNLKIILQLRSIDLNEVQITGNLKHLNTISKIDLETQPVNTSQDLLRKVPGLFIGQHAGGGKAEQIFLRGFDIDHGTDINISVDGMPVNMVSHAHGQGYADLHFVIPETIDNIDFDKGPYFADKGDLTTAGYVAFKTKDTLNKSTLGLDIGQYNTYRMLGQFNLLNTKNQSAYIATEYQMTDNYFDAPQNFRRTNFFGKYTAQLNSYDRFSVSLSHFTCNWDASGQIPERAVINGLISHFGAIGPTEGGNTLRSNLIVQYDKVVDQNSFIKNTAYLGKYNFELYSNFTFYLNDPINGDQIAQKENRTFAGFQSEYNKTYHLNGEKQLLFKLGTGLRNDSNKDIELSHMLNRSEILERLAWGDINQTNLFGYTSADFMFGKWLINAGLRYDYFKFDYEDKLTIAYDRQSVTKGTLSPKLNFLYTPNTNLQFFLKGGKGFHSNDTRVVVAQSGKDILPTAYGADLGLVWKPLPRMIVNSALWYLYLAQEFVYVGDEAIVEPSGRTQRKGVDLGLRYQLNNWLFLNGDYTYTYARAMEGAPAEDYIPLAPVNTFAAGLSAKNLKGFSAGARMRFLGDRPADETNTVTAKGYFITDLSANYQFKNFSVGFNIDNVFNVKWKETQFLTESRLYSEASAVEEIHYTAGTPFFSRLMLRYSF